MDEKELATLLNGREYLSEITKEEEELAKKNGLVVVFGQSDDLMEFRGAINDEFDCYGGGTAYLTKEGLLENDCEDEYCPYFNKIQQEATQILAVWIDGITPLDEKGWTWQYRSKDLEGKFETFEILEDGEKYCKGIVFSIYNLK
ncbi:MAG: hypothetical protein WCK67_08055 [bacterium]